MAINRQYIGSERDQDYFKRVFQSANINFLIGAGASVPAINLLGNIEEKLQNLITGEQEDEYFSEAANFLKVIWGANNILLERNFSEGENNQELQKLQNNVETVLNNYNKFLRSLGEILNNRRTGLLPRRINIFTTNYDLFIECAAINNNGFILNDGFSRRADIFNKIKFDATSFYQTTYTTGNLYNYSAELATLNLIKIHGSLSWKRKNEDVLYHIRDMCPSQFTEASEKKNGLMTMRWYFLEKKNFERLY